MTEEEKAIIKNLKDTFSEDMEKITFYEDGIAEIRKALNLIEKQAKEIEELNKQYDQLTQYFIKNHVAKDKIRNFIEKHKDNFYDGTANGCDYIDYEVIKEFIDEE